MSVYNPGTWNYDATALATNEVYALRAEVQDTDNQAWLLSDQEYEYAISLERNYWAAAARCAEMIARGFLKKQDVQLGRSMRILYSTMSQKYMDMAVTLRRKAAGTVVPFVGGMSVSQKWSYLNDSDLLAALFTKTQQQNPWTGGYTSDSLAPVGNATDDAGYYFG